MADKAEKTALLPEAEHGAGTRKRRTGKGRRVVCLLLLAALVAVVAAMAVLTPLVFLKKNDSNSSPSSSRQFASAAVAADSGLCSEAGAGILRNNGSAVDAAISTMLCIGVVNAHSAGLGGGAFILVYTAASRSSEVIDCREEAPGLADKDMFVDHPEKALKGGLAVGVPGELRGMREAWLRHGVLDWADLFQPAVRIARDGFAMTPAIASAVQSSRAAILEDPGLRSIYTRDDDVTLLVVGDTIKRPQLADLFEKLAADPEDFYSLNGTIAQQIVADIRDHGGIITAEDLAAYRPIIRSTLNISLTPTDVSIVAPPPSSGVVSNLILDILRNYNTSLWNTSVTDYHRLVEAMKYAYGQRLTLGDPDFDNIVNETVANMTDPIAVLQMFDGISDEVTYGTDHYLNWWSTEPTRTGTSHISVAAANGDAVAVTTTINTYFGAKIRSPTLGLIYNNEMDDFSTPNVSNVYGYPPSPSNFIDPRKRPMSSMSPTIVVARNGTLRMVVGASGGNTIITAVAQTIINNMFLGRPVGDAIESKRLHDQLLPDRLEIERGFDEATIAGLAEIHNVTDVSSLAVVQGIVKTAEHVEAACDSRKGGYPDGY